MARSRTLAEMRSDVRLRADLVGNQFVDNTEIDEYLNQSIAELYDLLVESRGQEYYVTTQTITTAANVETYALPTDHYTTIYVELEYGGNRIRLGSYSMHERASLIGATASYVSQPRAFRLQGGNISLLPVPDGVYTVRHFYTRACPRLVSDTDAFDGIDGWEEYAIWRTVAYVQQKEQLDTSISMGFMGQLANRIKGLAPFRAQQNTERVTDVFRGYLYDADPSRYLPRP